MKNGKFSAHSIATLAILLALVVVLQTFGGAIVIGAVQFNFTLVPIVLGAILLGAGAGAFLGFACGIVVLIQVIVGLVPFYTIIWTGSPVVAALTCVVKTTVAGWVAGIVFKVLRRRNQYVAIFVASAIVPVLNTALFILGCLGMWNSIATMAGGSNVFGFILVGLVGFNFFVEVAVNLLVAPGLERVVRAIGKNYFQKTERKKQAEESMDVDKE